jgi:hypothetical protein
MRPGRPGRRPGRREKRLAARLSKARSLRPHMTRSVRIKIFDGPVRRRHQRMKFLFAERVTVPVTGLRSCRRPRAVPRPGRLR